MICSGETGERAHTNDKDPGRRGVKRCDFGLGASRTFLDTGFCCLALAIGYCCTSYLKYIAHSVVTTYYPVFELHYTVFQKCCYNSGVHC